MIDLCVAHLSENEEVPATRIVRWEGDTPIVMACDECALDFASLELEGLRNIMIRPIDEALVFLDD